MNTLSYLALPKGTVQNHTQLTKYVNKLYKNEAYSFCRNLFKKYGIDPKQLPIAIDKGCSYYHSYNQDYTHKQYCAIALYMINDAECNGKVRCKTPDLI